MAEWTWRGMATATASISTRRLSSSHAVNGPHLSARRRPRSLPPLSVAVGAGVAALAFTASTESVRRLRATAYMGVLVVHESEMVSSFQDAATLAAQWSQLLGLGGLQDELVGRLLSCVLRLQDDEQSQETLRFLTERGALPLLVQYAAWNKPMGPKRLQQLTKTLVKLLEAAAANGQTELQLSILTLAQALAHLTQQDEDVVSYVDLLQLGDALTKVQQLNHKRLEEGEDSSRAFRVYRSELTDVDSDKVAESCAALVQMCSPEMPDSMKKFGLCALSALLRALNREEFSAIYAQQLEAALGTTFANMLLDLPRSTDDGDLQLLAATVMDRLLHVARENPAAVSRDTYGLWMEQIRYWAGSQPEQTLEHNTRAWFRRNSGHNAEKDEEAKMRNHRLHLQLQLTSSRCLRTLTASPQSRRYVCESASTRAAFFELSRQVHEKKQESICDIDEDTARNLTSIQRHLSWTFRNICTGFQSGAMALNSLFDASWTASLLQSRRDLPMSRFFRGISDLTDLPILGAEEYEASTEFGWVDILTAWSTNSDHQMRENAIASLVYLAEQNGSSSPTGLVPEEEDGIRKKQEHILQAWLTSMLQQIRLLSGGELLAVKQMEEIAHVSKDLTPGNERVLFNPAVVDAGTSALAVLAEHHHGELVRQGVVQLVALLSATSAETPAQRTQCARVLANLVASFCLDIDPRSSALSTDPARAVVSSDHADIAKMLKQTASGKRFLADIHHWGTCKDPMQRSNYFRVIQNLRAYDEVVATGRLVKDVYCEGVHPIVSQSDTNSMEESGSEKPAPVIDVVFVHGLRGHPFGTWRTDMGNKIDGNNDVWPDVLLAKDLERNNVPARLVTLGYEAGMVSWSSPWPSLTLQERGRVMLKALYAANIGRQRHHPGAPARPVVFITHSMGGLLTKKMLLLEHEQRDRSGLADSTTGVVFLAVPHFGSDLAKGMRSESIRKLIQTHPAIQDLGADPSGRLKDLNDRFKQLGIDSLSVGEERAAPVALGLSAVVVKPDSANPGTGRFYVLPDSDHMTICKAKTRYEPLYQDIVQYVLEHAASARRRA